MNCVQTSQRRVAALLILILLPVGTGIRHCGAQEAGGQGSALGGGDGLPAKHIFDLNYRPGKFGFTVLCESVGRVRFLKEPDFGNRDIVRGLIPIGTDKKKHIGFAWDRARGKLYLDLNRNKDLTDDANGVFQSHTGGGFQIFRGIHLSLQVGTLKLPYQVRMEMYHFGQNRHSCSATIASGFEAEMTLYGRKWDVAVVDNMSGSVEPGDHLFLAPKNVDLGAALNWRKMNVPRSIFFDSHHYDVSFDFKPGTDEPALQLTLTESEKPMGRLDIDGANIARLVLGSGSSTILLHYPDKRVSIPAGDYDCRSIFLYDEKAGIFEGEHMGVAERPPVFIRPDHSAILKAGGPLNNSVDVRRAGNNLILSYKLTGAGRRGYKRLDDRRDSPPAFAIYRGNTKIVSDSFEYG